MREVIYKDELVTITAVKGDGRLYLRRIVDDVASSEFSLSTREMDALCEWWTKKRAKEAK